MTHLKLDLRGKLTLGFLFAIGCSSHVQIANGDATGGQSAENTGGFSANGGNSSITVGGGVFATGGGPMGGAGGTTSPSTGIGGHSILVTGGAGQYTGGVPATGGARPNATGGYFCCVVTGGSPSNTGGAPQTTGGAPSNTGGSPSNTGGEAATGGAYPTGGWTPSGGADASGGYQATGGAFQYTGGGPNNVGYPTPPCTLGADQTCTDDVTVTSLVGQCGADGGCTCNDPDIVNPHTGKCNTYPQTVCYSPTQNIDQAYVNRAFGCHCNATTPFCGIDSSGLLVYLVCTSGMWQSGDTSNCKG